MHGLNLAVPEKAKELIKPWSNREDTTQFADSCVDDQVRMDHAEPGGDIMRPCLQMIIHVPFSQNVRIKSVILKLGKVPPLCIPPVTTLRSLISCFTHCLAAFRSTGARKPYLDARATA